MNEVEWGCLSRSGVRGQTHGSVKTLLLGRAAKLGLFPHHQEGKRGQEIYLNPGRTVLHTPVYLVGPGRLGFQVATGEAEAASRAALIQHRAYFKHAAQHPKGATRRAHILASTTDPQRGPNSAQLRMHTHCPHARSTATRSAHSDTSPPPRTSTPQDAVSHAQPRPQLHTSLSTIAHQAIHPRPAFRTTLAPAAAHTSCTRPASRPRALPPPRGPAGAPTQRPALPAPPPSARVASPPSACLARSLAPSRFGKAAAGRAGASGGGAGRGRVTCERRAGGRWKGERHGARNKRVGVGKSRPSRRGSGRSVRAPAAPRLRAPAPGPGAVPARSLAPAARARPGSTRRPRVRVMRR